MLWGVGVLLALRSIFYPTHPRRADRRTMADLRPDRGTHRQQFDKNKKKILATQDICGICGKPVDKTLKYPNPLAPCIDHIIPVSKNGHPSDISNLQLAHWTCNRQKSDKTYIETPNKKAPLVIPTNRNLPLARDWSSYTAGS